MPQGQAGARGGGRGCQGLFAMEPCVFGTLFCFESKGIFCLTCGCAWAAFLKEWRALCASVQREMLPWCTQVMAQMGHAGVGADGSCRCRRKWVTQVSAQMGHAGVGADGSHGMLALAPPGHRASEKALRDRKGTARQKRHCATEKALRDRKGTARLKRHCATEKALRDEGTARKRAKSPGWKASAPCIRSQKRAKRAKASAPCIRSQKGQKVLDGRHQHHAYAPRQKREMVEVVVVVEWRGGLE